VNNKNTTIAGIGAILVSVGGVLVAWFDGDASTTPDFTTAVAAIVAGVGLIVARDAKKPEAPSTEPTQ
jgi:drug/metabolite transporter (DMT)-like permease